jgi:hypothetical protein
VAAPGAVGGLGAGDIVLAAEDGIAVRVVPGTLLGIGDDLIGSLDFSKPSGGVRGVVEVAIWMEL